VPHDIPFFCKDVELFLKRGESMAARDTQPAGVKKTFERALGNRLNAVGWGLFLAMLGGLSLASTERVPEGTWLVGTSLIILGIGVVRCLNDIQVNWFWIGLGILALGTGVGEIVGSSLPVFPILLTIAGIATLFKVFFVKEQR
jgi:hypothetical protein